MQETFVDLLHSQNACIFPEELVLQWKACKKGSQGLFSKIHHQQKALESQRRQQQLDKLRNAKIKDEHEESEEGKSEISDEIELVKQAEAHDLLDEAELYS